MPFSSLKSEFELFEITELVFGNELIHEHKINKYIYYNKYILSTHFLHLHFKFTFTFTFSPLYNHKILPVTFVTAPQSFYFFTFLLFYL